MKNKRILIVTIAVIVLMSVVMGALVACNNNDDTSTKTITVTLMDNVQTVTTEKAFLGDVLKDLKASGLIKFEYQDSTFGMFITSINDMTLASNEFVGIYLSADDPTNADLLIPTVTVGDTIYYSANKGADTLPIINGVKYYLTVVVF